MALRDFFKKVPESELERRQSLRDPEQILAWLEELSRLGTMVELECSDNDLTPVLVKVRTVGEEARTCSFAFRWKPVKELVAGQRVRIVFPLDRQRFQGELVYQGRGNYLEYRFGLPSAFYHAERRDAVRVKMRPRDDLHVIALQGFFEGLGFTGSLLDLSMGGCSFLLQRAIQIKGEKRLPVTADLMAPGTPLVLVRLPNLPHLPMVECGGRLCSMRMASEGVVAGVRFEGLGVPETAILGKFLGERDPGFTFGFPRKRRLHGLGADEPAGTPAETPPEESPEPQAETGSAPQPEGDDLPGGIGGLDSGPREVLTDKERLQRLKKRGKKILLIMGDELERISLMALLQHDGYRSLFEAQSLIQALEQHRRLPLDLVVVDQTVGHMGALKLVEVLRENGLPRETRVVVMQRTVDHQLTLATKGGKLNLLVPRPVDYPGTMQQPLEAMLGI